MSTPSRRKPPRSLTLRKFFEEVYCEHKPQLALRTIEDYSDQISIAEAFFREQRIATGHPERSLLLSDLTKPFVLKVIKKRLGEQKAAGTVDKFRRLAVTLTNFARREFDYDVDEISMQKLRELKRSNRAWLEGELQKLLTAAAEDEGMVGNVPAGIWLPALVLFVINTGCRITSVMRTPLACLDLEQGTVIVPAENQKHGADEPFPLTPECREALRVLVWWPMREPPALIFGDWPYDPWHPSRTAWPTLNGRLRTIIVRAGLRKTCKEVTRKDLWHKLRRTMASYVAARLGKAAAQQLLGHSSPGVTERYLDDRIVSRPDVRTALPKLTTALPKRIVG